MNDQAHRETERRREAYRKAASNLLAFGYESDEPLPAAQPDPPGRSLLERLQPVQGAPMMHVPPPDADWSAHVVGPDGYCEAHIDAASRGEVPYGGHVEVAEAEPMPEWRRKLAERPPMASWYLRRHHCSDVVMGQRPDEHPGPAKAPKGK